MLMKNILFSFLFLITASTAISQDYCFTSYGNNEGLIHSQVTEIHEGNDGFLWLSTLGGLSKFDGKKFVNFTERDGLLNNRVQCFYENDEALFLGLKGGLNYFKNQKIEKIRLDNSLEKVKKIFTLHNKVCFYTSENRYGEINKNYEIDTIYKLNVKDEIRNIESDNKNLYFVFKNHIEHFNPLTNSSIDTLVYKEKASFYKIQKKDNILYFSSYGYGIYSYNLYTKTTKFYNVENGLISNYIRGFSVEDNAIWLSTNKGVSIIKKDTITHLSTENGLPYNLINGTIKDKYGTYWIATSGNGLIKFQGENIFVYHKTADDKMFQSISFNNINASIHVGAYRGGIIPIINNKIKPAFKNTEQQSFWCSTNYNNNTYFGGDEGLYVFKNNEYNKVFKINSKVLSIYADKNSLWIGTRGELIHIKNNKIVERADFENVRTINKTKDGNLFIGTSNGLYNYTLNKYIELDSLLDNQIKSIEVNSIKIDAFNNLWVGAKTGLFKLSNDLLIPQIFSTKASANNIEFLNTDAQKNLWIGTLDGIYVLLQNDLKESGCNYLNTIHFGKSDGFNNLEGNQNAAYTDNKGNIWIGMKDQLYKLMPGFLTDKISNIPPIIKLQHVDSYLKQIKNTDKLSFKENKNYITINYKTIDLNSPEDIYYKFYLEGFDDDWLPITKQTQATYSNLTAGDYTFHVTSYNKFGIESNTIKIPINITPMFYNTWWFILLILISIFIITSLLVLAYKKSLLEKEETKQLKNNNYMRDLEQKSLNASMNRHFIFNALTSIQYYIIQNDRLTANKYLTRFAKLIRLNLDSSQANIVDLDTEIERLNLYLELEKMRFKTFDFKIEVDDTISISEIFVPPMILQPYVENSIIHGLQGGNIKDGLITISVKNEPDYVSIILKDNGVGFKEGLSKKEKEKGDHTSYGTEITKNRIDLFSKMEEKNTIQLVGPKDILNTENEIVGTIVELRLFNLDFDN